MGPYCFPFQSTREKIREHPRRMRREKTREQRQIEGDRTWMLITANLAIFTVSPTMDNRSSSAPGDRCVAIMRCLRWICPPQHSQACEPHGCVVGQETVTLTPPRHKVNEPGLSVMLVSSSGDFLANKVSPPRYCRDLVDK